MLLVGDTAKRCNDKVVGMDSIANVTFFQLIRVAIGESADFHQLSEEEWDALYTKSKEQALTAVVFQAVNRLPAELQPPRKLKLRWIMQVEKIAKRNADVNKVAVTVSEQFSKAGVPNCILKGPGNALMYPQPGTRTSGDIDIWLMADPDKVIRLVKKVRPKARAVYHHIDFPRIEGVPMELHYRPQYMNNLVFNARLQKWFLEKAEEQSKNRVELPDGVGRISVPTDSFNRIFQISHIFKHVTDEGIGLRQLLDYYYLLQKGFTEEERQEDERLLRRFGLYKLTAAVMYVLQEVFGLKQEKMIVPVNERLGKFLLEEILLAGNFGHYDKRVSHGGGKLQKNTNRLKRDFRQIRYFPSESLWEPIFRWYHYFWRVRHNRI